MGETAMWVTWLGWIIALVTGIFAIRATVRFDVNEWLKERRKQKEAQLTKLCPHVRVSNQDGGTILHSSYISPPGTLAYICELCGDTTFDASLGQRLTEYWAKNPTALRERYKEMRRVARQLGRK